MVGVCQQKAGATGILYQFDDIFSTSAATFQDTDNGVLLTSNDKGLSAGEFLSALNFNINPADNVNNLIFIYQGGSSGLTGSGFNFLSTPAGGNGLFYSPENVQGIGGSSDNSVLIDPSADTKTLQFQPSFQPFPEPASVAIFMFAAGILGAARVRWRRAKA